VPRSVGRKRDLSARAAERLGERERALGLDGDDAAARWLVENDPPAPAPEPKFKSKVLHQWRRRQTQTKP
jgi:hypothetical protein